MTHKVHADIQGEDVATITMQATSGAHVVVEMAYAGGVAVTAALAASLAAVPDVVPAAVVVAVLFSFLR